MRPVVIRGQKTGQKTGKETWRPTLFQAFIFRGATVFLISLAFVCLFFLSGCSFRETSFGGQPVYRDIEERTKISYGFIKTEEFSPNQLKDFNTLLTLAVNYWNQAIGRKALSLASGPEQADVKIMYREVDELNEQPAYLDLPGCMNGLSAIFDCRINLEVPAYFKEPSDFTLTSHLFHMGPIDEKLFLSKNYVDVGDYLRDKLILISLVHEIGHSIGLAHSADPSCVMAPAPYGDIKFCPAEIKAARLLLTGSDGR